MSLNDLLDFIKIFILSIPLTLFDYILILALIGYVIEEESYNIGIVIKRSIFLFFCMVLSLFLYRLPSLFFQNTLFVSKGISDAISLLGVWLISLAVINIISHFVIGEKMNNFMVSKKLRIPSTILIACMGFLGLTWIILHVFISLPLPLSAKKFITSSFLVEKILLGTFKSDFSIQRVYTVAPDSVLHIEILNEEVGRKDLRIQSVKATKIPADFKILESINRHREAKGRNEVIEVELLSTAASDLALKYSQEGIIEDQASHLVSILTERGIIFSEAKTVTVVSDSIELISEGLFANNASRIVMQSSNYEKIGLATYQLNNSSFLTVFLFIH